MNVTESQRYEAESVARAHMKPIAKHSKPKKQAKQPEGASA